MAELMLVNPRKRKTRRKARKTVAAKPRRRVTRKTVARRSPARRIARRRNPIAKGNLLNDAIIPAATGAAGAVGLDVAMGYIPLPDALKTGPARHLVKGAAAIGLGMLASLVTKKSTAKALANGALTVTMHGAMQEAMQRFAPGVQMGQYVDGMGQYVDGMGYVSPAMTYDGGDASTFSPIPENEQSFF